MKKILIIDDNIALVNAIKIKLNENSFEVLSAYNGEEGLNLAIENCPDLIILDISLPRMTGNEVARKCKENELTTAIPIIILSSMAPDKDNDILQKITDAYILKPVKMDVLLEKINEILNI